MVLNRLTNLPTEIYVAVTYIIVALLTSIQFVVSFAESDAYANITRVIVVVLLVSVSFLLIRKGSRKP